MCEDFINSKNIDLYHEVLENSEIKLIRSTKWASRINNKTAEILYNESNFSFACFTHELLHIKYHHLGLKYPKYEFNENIDELITYLFNQLSHHKFFNEFCSLGFNKKEFLDVETETQANEQAELNITILEITNRISGKLEPSIDLLNIYLMLKSPHDDSKITFNFLERLKNIGNEDFFSIIDKILDDWLNSTSLNPCLTLAKFFKVCNHPKIGFYIYNKDEIIYSNDI